MNHFYCKVKEKFLKVTDVTKMQICLKDGKLCLGLEIKGDKHC